MFGYPTQKVRIRSRHSPSDLLRSLFLNDRPPFRRSAGRRPGRNIPHPSSDPSELPLELHPQTITPESHTDPQTSRDFDTASVASSDSLSLPKAAVISGLEFSGTPAQRALLQALSDQSFVLEDDPETVWKLPHDFMVIYVCPNDARERPKIHPSLVNIASYPDRCVTD